MSGSEVSSSFFPVLSPVVCAAPPAGQRWECGGSGKAWHLLLPAAFRIHFGEIPSSRIRDTSAAALTEGRCDGEAALRRREELRSHPPAEYTAALPGNQPFPGIGVLLGFLPWVPGRQFCRSAAVTSEGIPEPAAMCLVQVSLRGRLDRQTAVLASPGPGGLWRACLRGPQRGNPVLSSAFGPTSRRWGAPTGEPQKTSDAHPWGPSSPPPVSPAAGEMSARPLLPLSHCPSWAQDSVRMTQHELPSASGNTDLGSPLDWPPGQPPSPWPHRCSLSRSVLTAGLHFTRQRTLLPSQTSVTACPCRGAVSCPAHPPAAPAQRPGWGTAPCNLCVHPAPSRCSLCNTLRGCKRCCRLAPRKDWSCLPESQVFSGIPSAVLKLEVGRHCGHPGAGPRAGNTQGKHSCAHFIISANPCGREFFYLHTQTKSVFLKLPRCALEEPVVTAPVRNARFGQLWGPIGICFSLLN